VTAEEHERHDRRRMKRPPFKRQVLAALEAAKTAGATHVQIKTSDGATFEFDLREGLALTHDQNDFDAKPPRRGNT
jgi:hypothetical protein